jgi:hypothetical protein
MDRDPIAVVQVTEVLSTALARKEGLGVLTRTRGRGGGGGGGGDVCS